MKKVILISLMVAAGFVFAAQDTTLDQREVRDPKKLETWLEANASDAETRLAAIEGGSATISLDANKINVGNSSSNEVAMGVTGDVALTQDGTNATLTVSAASGDFAVSGDMTGSSNITATLTVTGADLVSTDDVTVGDDLIVTGTRISAASLPTATNGLAVGDLWNNSNVINIVP